MGPASKRKYKGGRGDQSDRRKPRYDNSGRGGSGQAVPAGCRGFLITTDGGKENPASRQAIALFEQYFDKLCPAEAAAPVADAPNAGDVSGSLEAELAQLKEGGDEKEQKPRFRYHSTGVNQVIFIIMRVTPNGPGPVELLDAICTEIEATRTSKTRNCIKCLPVTHACFAGLPEIKALAEGLVPEAFPAEDAAPSLKYAVQFEHKAAAKLDRMEVINSFADLVPKEKYTVNLSEPDRVIHVQLLKNAACVSVLPHFHRFKKYNLRILAQTDEERAAEQAEQLARAAARAAESGGGTAARAAAKAPEKAPSVEAVVVDPEQGKAETTAGVEVESEPPAASGPAGGATPTAADAAPGAGN